MSINPNFRIEAASFDLPYFSWNNPYLEIKTSDADGSQIPPPATDMILHPGHKECDDKILDWKKKLGRLLVEDFLAIDLGKEGVKQYQLANFPAGYKFYMKRRTPRGRGDGYLLGGGRRFRSPQEFVFHAAWLMDGMPASGDHASDHSTSQDEDEDPGCTCKYCSGMPQKKLNERMKKQQKKIKERLQKAMQDGTIIHRGINARNKLVFRTPKLSKGKKAGSRRSASTHHPHSNQGSSSDEVHNAVTKDHD